ncbi:dihydrodipicolinate reductase [Desulfatitalea alkaliphila]|uniref:4-hydroxy-tetrahydrodipicolinate reductase n=1 Tax=Desulfatitalea alkaliphila TaxID=2929485 RepID=A0AA41R4A3_9BACT|nr:dihydrodipicolinate reductase [Desulfatitalea alkaliphila]MCJ8500815.1 dihydrodipicolinate reductase [Desulfatitalea alkaliphila]
MNPIPVMINGLPGNVARVIATHIMADAAMQLLPFSLTGPEIDIAHCHLAETPIALIRPEAREERIAAIKTAHPGLISVDFTHPTAVNANAEFYCRFGLPFVMGTTGGDRDALLRTVVDNGGLAVIAPNMAKQIVGFQAMMAHAADTFPNLFQNYQLTIRESHQAGKADTSGTAKAMVTYFNRMGVAFNTDQIQKERDPERQANQWGVPPEHLGGHAWHTYTLTSPDGTARFEFSHNVNGRDIYGEGTRDAIRFLARKVADGEKGRVYSMVDVLKAGGIG